MTQPPVYSIRRHRGVWWLVDPRGRRQFYTSVQCVGPKHGSRVPGAPAYDGIAANGGSLHAWILETEGRLKAWGFKGLGAWNHGCWRWRDVPYTECLNIWKSLNDRHGLKGVFDADFAKAVDDLVRPQIKTLRDSPALIGWFLDNEIPWNPGWMDRYFNGRTTTDPNRRAVLAFLRGRYGTIGRLNARWGTHLTSWGALARARKLPAPPDEARADRLAFLGLAARRFFRIACAAVRRHDPRRPILGVRYAGFPLAPVVAAQRGLTDVVSMNCYIQEGSFPVAKALEAHRLSGGQPVWITEFSWHAPYDNRSGDRNTIGFGSRVRRQASRGRGYARFVGGAAALPFVIGCDWFQWCDESPQGRGGDGEDVNFGLVDIRNRPYEDLIRSITRTNRTVDGAHARSARARPAEAAVPALPSIAVPRGVATAVLPGLRFRDTLDPVPARPPVTARLGWEPGALTVTVDAGDPRRTVETTKPRSMIEWFWMTDAVELLLRAGTAGPDALDAASVKLWAVPDGAGRGRPFVGGWVRHRRVARAPRGVTAAQARLPGGYRMTFRVPARLLQRGPFRAGQALRFNLLVDDCDRVQETCWSAHQGDWTTERPATWGFVRLTP